MIPIRLLSLALILLSTCSTSVNSYYWNTDPNVAPFIYWQGDFLIPPVPPASWGSMSVWPGLNNGWFQPLLEFLSTPPYQWYVIPYFSYTPASYFVAYPGDTVRITMEMLPGRVQWRQTMMSLLTGQTGTLDADFEWPVYDVWLYLESYGFHAYPAPSMIVKNISMIAQASSPAFCTTTVNNASNFIDWECTTPIISGNRCTVAMCTIPGPGH